MGDFPGHPFRGNQYTVGTRVRYSDEVIRRKQADVGRYGDRRLNRAIETDLEKTKAKRGTVTAVLHAEKDYTPTLTKKGDFVGYEVKFDDEPLSTHRMMPHMITADTPSSVPEDWNRTFHDERGGRVIRVYGHPAAIDRAVKPGTTVSRGDYKRSRSKPAPGSLPQSREEREAELERRERKLRAERRQPRGRRSSSPTLELQRQQDIRRRNGW